MIRDDVGEFRHDADNWLTAAISSPLDHTTSDNRMSPLAVTDSPPTVRCIDSTPQLEFAAVPSLRRRVVDALWRRTRHLCSMLTQRDAAADLQRAHELLIACRANGEVERDVSIDTAHGPAWDAIRQAESAKDCFQRGDLRGGNLLMRQARRFLHTAALTTDNHLLTQFAESYLAATQSHVAATFAAGLGGTAQQLSSADARWRTLRQWIGRLPSAAFVADVGCGSGRYLSRVAQWRGDLRLLAIDPVEAFTDPPSEFEFRAGSLLDIPVDGGKLDAVYTIEALEHALLPPQAVAELCRCVRSGGNVFILDKHREHQALSNCHPWERWFTPQEIIGWLRPWCRQIAWQPVAHHASRSSRPLFGCWTGVRR